MCIFAEKKMQKLLTFCFSKNISLYAIFNDQSFNDTLTNDIGSFELGPGQYFLYCSTKMLWVLVKSTKLRHTNFQEEQCTFLPESYGHLGFHSSLRYSEHHSSRSEGYPDNSFLISLLIRSVCLGKIRKNISILFC